MLHEVQMFKHAKSLMFIVIYLFSTKGAEQTKISLWMKDNPAIPSPRKSNGSVS
jgi:hypothetical protein